MSDSESQPDVDASEQPQIKPGHEPTAADAKDHDPSGEGNDGANNNDNNGDTDTNGDNGGKSGGDSGGNDNQGGNGGGDNGPAPEGKAVEATKMFVGGITWNTTKEMLLEYFARFGEVTDAHVMVDRNTGRSRGFGFVSFREQAVADGLVGREDLELDGRKIDIKQAVPRAGPDNSFPTRKIFLGGLGPETTEAALRDYFGRFGPIEELQLVTDHNTGRPRGFAFLTYENENDTTRCCEKPFHEVNGKTVEAKKAVPRSQMGRGPPRGGRGGYGGGGGRGGYGGYGGGGGGGYGGYGGGGGGYGGYGGGGGGYGGYGGGGQGGYGGYGGGGYSGGQQGGYGGYGGGGQGGYGGYGGGGQGGYGGAQGGYGGYGGGAAAPAAGGGGYGGYAGEQGGYSAGAAVNPGYGGAQAGYDQGGYGGRGASGGDQGGYGGSGGAGTDRGNDRYRPY